MLDKTPEENQALRVDERLAKAVQIISEQFGGDVKAFVQSIRCKEVQANRKLPGASDHTDRATFREHL